MIRGTYMRRFGMFVLAVLPLLAAVLIQNIAVNSIVSAYIFITGNDVSQELMYLFYVIGILICGGVFYFWYRREIQGELRGSLREVFTIKNISLFAVLGIGCQFFFSGVLSLLTPFFIDVFSDYSEVLGALTSGNRVVVLLLMVVIAPVAEELIFRGVILHMANRYVTFIGANILQAVLFGIYHDNVVQGIYAALLGFLLGMVYYKFKTIFASILLHMMINTSSFLLYLLPDTTVSYVVTAITGAVCAAAALAVIKPLRRIGI
jgi:membrane protease YdiL (CAAX protease family)